MALVWGILLLPVGFGIQAIGLMKTRALPRWQGIMFLIGVLLVGRPDGVEIVILTASFLLVAAFIPYGIQLMVEKSEGTPPAALPSDGAAWQTLAADG